MSGLDLAEEGMQRTLDAERELWISDAMEALERYSRLPGRHEFTTEAFRAWFNRPPHSPKVWGALTNRACKAGVIEWTGKYIHSVSPKTHGHPVKVWRACFSLAPLNAGISRASVQINERTNP